VGEPEKLTLRCPDCGSHLVVDSATGEVLFHQRPDLPPAGGKGFEELLEELDQGKARAEDTFAREITAHENRDRLLEDKFRQAVEHAEENPDEGPPPSPFDFD